MVGVLAFCNRLPGSIPRCAQEECSVAVLLCLGAGSASASDSEAGRILAQVGDVAVLLDPLGCMLRMAARDSLTA